MDRVRVCYLIQARDPRGMMPLPKEPRCVENGSGYGRSGDAYLRAEGEDFVRGGDVGVQNANFLKP